ncbi:hypothetical protein I0C86_36630 [Plantactinospora sp. S1510]|uniref:Uncharacterized protein n=1 Tax=Plantactinospora alkalitolerans TaxID=2789879 RepID=A0ABS0H7Z3_9ACTN|nr:hypothetical protein [Plantactinospora alkalitolerans]MBF9134416.1 hypothetical protein [Plantactinospora alkalitolerans]
MEEQREVARDGIVAVASDDTFAHAYPDLRALREDSIMAPDSDHRNDLEFFDVNGRRLLPVFGPTGKLTELREAAGEPDPRLLQRRLTAVVHHAENHLRAHPELTEPFGLTPDEAIATLPRPETQNLAQTLAAFPHQERPHIRAAWWQPRTVAYATPGSWFHNSLHAAGWTHS